MATVDEVRSASQQFYSALNRMLNGDAASLAEIWSHSSSVTTMHPIGGRETGWDQVEGAWAQVAQLASGGQVTLNDQAIQASEDMAYEVGRELGQVKLAGQQVGLEHRVTNVYRKEAGGWKIVHHHTDLSSEMVDLLKRLQAKV